MSMYLREMKEGEGEKEEHRQSDRYLQTQGKGERGEEKRGEERKEKERKE